MPLREWLENELRAPAQARLNAYAQRPGAPNVMVTWVRNDPRTLWFREGTIRAVVYDFVEQHVWANEPEWLPLAEQAYPGLPDRLRTDIALHGTGGRWMFIEIKADFDQSRADRDIDKLLAVKNQIGAAYGFGLLLYSIWNEAPAIQRWEDALDVRGMQRLGLGRALPLIRM